MKVKKILGLTAVIFSFAAVPLFSESLTADGAVYGGKLDYMICDGKAIITGTEGEPEILCVPGTIDGKPVCEIRENAFYKCKSLKSITLPETVTRIGHHAFAGCTALETADIKTDAEILGEGCFSGCLKLENIFLGDKLRTIGENCFYRCESLREIAFPHDLREIQSRAFCGCLSLEEPLLPDELHKIGDKAFFNCPSLEKINIPDSVSELGVEALGLCDGFKKVSDLVITGSENSLASAYAYDNSFTFMPYDSEKESSPKTIPIIPIAIVIASGAGLMFLGILEKASDISETETDVL